MGQIKFASLRRTYDILLDGQRLPKHDYSFRVDANKISATMQFMQNTLQLKPGYTRNVSLAGYDFEAMPVYQRGGRTSDELFMTYIDAIDES